MPTPTGKPKVGEKVEWRGGQTATVLRRSDGAVWGVYVRWDDPPLGQPRERWITEAQYWIDRGDLRVVTS
jgi:hypothetical protein